MSLKLKIFIHIIQYWKYPYIGLVSRLTEMLEIKNYLELVFKHPRNVSQQFSESISYKMYYDFNLTISKKLLDKQNNR